MSEKDDELITKSAIEAAARLGIIGGVEWGKY